MEQIKLTIAIPTYNRIKQLRNTLSLLTPQLNSDCELVIIDNASEVNVEYEISDYTSSLDIKYTIIRNHVNIGASPNIAKCFQEVTQGWMWLLSDDDFITENAIETIFETIKLYPDAININFYSPNNLHKERTETKVFKGKMGLMDSIDTWPAAIFMSSNLYNTSKFHSYWEATRFAYSCVAQWAILLFNISENDLVVQSDQIIVYNKYVASKYTNINLPIMDGFMTLLDIPLSKELRKKMLSKLLTVDDGWIKFQNIIRLLIIENARNDFKYDALFHLKRYFSRFYKYGHKINFVLYVFAYLGLCFFPKTTFGGLRKILLRRGKSDINEYLNN